MGQVNFLIGRNMIIICNISKSFRNCHHYNTKGPDQSFDWLASAGVDVAQKYQKLQTIIQNTMNAPAAQQPNHKKSSVKHCIDPTKQAEFYFSANA